MLSCPFVLLAGILAGSSLPVAAQSEDKVQAQVSQYLGRHKAWSQAQNTPGVMITTRELRRETVEGKTLVLYEVRISGDPDNTTYSLIDWPIDTPDPAKAQTRLRGITRNQNGVLICAGRPGTCGTPENPNDPIELAVVAAKGEPKRFALVSDDEEISAFFQLVPFPNRATEGNCRLEIERLMPLGELLVLSGKAFRRRAISLSRATLQAREMHFRLEAMHRANSRLRCFHLLRAKVPGR
jgi:hypothetical protein